MSNKEKVLKHYHDLMIGVTLHGRYYVDDVIDAGGMSVVLRGYDKEKDETCAIKMLRDDLEDEKASDRFLSEAAILRQLDHPNVVRVTDVHSAEPGIRPYYVMEYLDGDTLKNELKRRKTIPADEVAQYTSEVLDALDYIHTKSILHRDLKPHNLMLTNGHVKLIDFGISRSPETPRYTLYGKISGTPQYIAPERVRNDGCGDARTDIYSLGVTMYELLSGHPPFDGENPDNVMHSQESDQAVPLERCTAKKTPVGLCQIVERAMEKDPDDRFSDAKEMKTYLDAYRADPTIRFSRLAMRLHRKPTRAAVSAAILGGIAAVAIAAVVLICILSL